MKTLRRPRRAADTRFLPTGQATSYLHQWNDLFTLTDDGIHAAHSQGNCTDCYPSDAEFARMESEKEDAYRAAFPQVTPNAKRYPMFAERLADSIRDDRRP